MSKIPAINEIDANSPSQESTEVVVNNTRITPDIDEVDGNVPGQSSTEVIVNATTVTPDINEIKETISGAATIQEIDGTRKPTISEIYKIVNDGLFESTTNWWDYAYKLSQAQLNQDIISRLDNGVIGGGYSKGVDIITTTSNKVPNNTNVYSALKSDSLYPKKLNDEVINGIYDFLNGLTIGKPTAYTGGTWSVDQTGRTHLTTDYLYVRLKAIFETLQILNVDTIGGKLVISPAGSIRVAYVDRIKIDAPVFTYNEETDVWSISQVEDAEGNLVNETLNQEVYRCYFLGEQDGEEIDNKWKVGDQAQAKTFNVKKGTYHKVENSYFWRLVVNVSSDTVDIDGKKYHYVDLSQIDFDSGSDAPAPGDILNQLGHRLNDTQRQTALVLNAVDNFAPSITLYAGVNYYTLLNKEYVEFGVYNGKAFFNVYGDMYIGDKGENPKTYIKYKNGKINIKANLEIGSSIGDKDLDQYIKENGGVDEETVKNLINNAQVIKDLQKQTDGAIETWFYEGVPTPNNYPSTDKENKGDVLTYNIPGIDWYNEDINNYNAIKDSDKYTEAEKEAIKVKTRERHIGDLYYDQKTGYAYRFTRYDDDIKPYRWNVISDSELTKILEAANKAQATADGKMKVFYGETKPTNYQVGDMWVNATLEGKFNNDIARAVANSESFNADDWVLASRYSEAIATIQKWTNEYETKFSNLAEDVKNQKDQSIIVWYLEYEPTLNNLPASGWTKDEKSEHIGDIVYDIKNNHSYRWTGSAWVQIKDADFNDAMKAAKAADDKAGAAGDLANSKRRIFYSDVTPTKPFDKGDLWIKQVKGKTETWVYNGTDWVKSEDKDLADFSFAINTELTGIKGQLDGKAETWYQNTNPRNEKTGKWESGGTDKSHKGDIWYDTTNGTTKYWNGSAWENMDIPKDVFDTIDGKSSIFVDSYEDAKAGAETAVICKGYKERDLWILPADATVNGVKYYKGDILTATSTNTKFDETNWGRKVRYIGPTELNKAIDIVNYKIDTINTTTIPGINNKFNEFIKDGVLDSSEKARLTDLLNQASNEVAAVVDQVNNITTSKYLINDNANKGKLDEANTVMNTAWTEYKNFIDTLIDANTEITKVNVGEANTKYKNLQEKIKAVKQYLAICQADILSGIGTDISSYKYLKEAFKGKTEVNGGLVVTNVLQLRQTSDASSPVTAGISGLQGKANANGVVDKDTYDITSIAAWFGGPMVDKDIFTDEQLNNKVAGTDYARSLFRHDGSGYLASGAIYWGTDGVLHGDPNSFILQGTSIATMFFYVRLFYLHNPQQGSTDFNKITYVTPMKTFSRLSVLPLGGIEDGKNLPTGLFIGDSITGGSFQIGNIILRTKSGDPNILEIVSADSKKTAHLGVQGGVSAYGTYTPSTGGGGGLNGTIVPYSTAIASDPQNEGSKIASASSIYKLHSRIFAIENNGATSITVTGTGNAITSVSKNGTSITFTKGVTFLTSHQSLANCVQIVTTTGTGNAVTSISKSGSTITVTKGATFLTSHQSLSAYLKSADAANTYLKLSGGAMTGNIRYKGSKDTYDMITFVDNNVNTYGNGICIGGGGLTIIGGGESANEVLSQHTSGGDEYMIVANDGAIDFFSNLQDGWYSRKAGSFDTSGYWNGAGFKKDNSSDSYVLLGGGGHKAISSLSVNYASSAGSASSVAWSNVSGRPTKVSQFTNDNGYITSSGSCAYATSAGNADKVDGVHANGLLTALSNSDKGISITVGGTTKSVANISVNYASSAGNADTVDGYHATSGRTFDGNINWSLDWNDSWSDGTNTHPWYGFDNRYPNTGAYSTTITDYFGMTIKTANTLRLDFGTLLLNGTDIHNINVASASKLATARTIWGQSFDGTGNVNGTIYINNSNSSNGAIRLNSDVNSNARISAIDDQVIFNTGNAIRFGETAWDWNQWAGLKYNHSAKTIYLGIADGSTFTANSGQSDGTLRLAGIKTITPDSGARIGGSGGDLYLGNVDGSAWVRVQKIRNQSRSGDELKWYINEDGECSFEELEASAIMYTKPISNKHGMALPNWDGSIGANVTNMFNGIPYDNISIEYSQDNGVSWSTYTLDPSYRFNLVNDNTPKIDFILGNNYIVGNTLVDKRNQIKKNQLRVTIKIPNEIYQELSWISVDVSNSVNINCEVYFGSNSGKYSKSTNKVIRGNNHICDICVGPLTINVGNPSYRYVRLVFSHLSNHTLLNNGIIRRIRALALTKYKKPGDRYNISTTGHIYNYDYNMNTYFPNSILAKGGVTAYQSSDVRLKTNITKLNCLNVIKSIGGTYEFDYLRDHKHSIGFIAQNVNNPLLKDIVAKDKDGYLKINYWSPKLISLAFGALTEIDNEVDKLKARVRELETEVEYLKNKDYVLQ